jgi:hypothetical protein
MIPLCPLMYLTSWGNFHSMLVGLFGGDLSSRAQHCATRVSHIARRVHCATTHERGTDLSCLNRVRVGVTKRDLESITSNAKKGTMSADSLQTTDKCLVYLYNVFADVCVCLMNTLACIERRGVDSESERHTALHTGQPSGEICAT